MSNNTDRQRFDNAWKSMCRTLKPHKDIPPTDLDLVWLGLTKEFAIDEIIVAISKHINTAEWKATPANIREILIGTLPSNDRLHGLAMDCNTALGWHVKQLLTRHTLASLPDRYVKERIAQRHDNIVAWVQRYQLANVSDEHLLRMISDGVDPMANLAHGLPGVRLPKRAQFHKRITALRNRRVISPPVDYPVSETPLSDDDRKKLSAQMHEFISTLGRPKSLQPEK